MDYLLAHCFVRRFIVLVIQCSDILSSSFVFCFLVCGIYFLFSLLGAFSFPFSVSIEAGKLLCVLGPLMDRLRAVRTLLIAFCRVSLTGQASGRLPLAEVVLILTC